MDSGCDEVNDLDDLINLTYNLDNYDFIPDIKDYDDLGRYYFFEGGYNIDNNKFGSFVDYIDFERYGEDCAINEGGTLTDAGTSVLPAIAGTATLTGRLRIFPMSTASPEAARNWNSQARSLCWWLSRTRSPM